MFERVSGLQPNDSIFKVGGRISRQKYLRNLLILTCFSALPGRILIMLEKSSIEVSGQAFPPSIWFIYIALIAPVIYLIYENVFKRYQDIKGEVLEIPTKLGIVVASLIPFLNIIFGVIFLVSPTNDIFQDKHSNQKPDENQDSNWENHFRNFKDEKLHSINSIKSYFSPLPENQEKLVEKIYNNFIDSYNSSNPKQFEKDHLEIKSLKDDFYSKVRLTLSLLGIRSVELKELKEKSSNLSSTVTKIEEITEPTKISNQQHSSGNRIKGPNSKIEEINKLISLKENGHITESEFQELKEEVFKKAS
jgi:large-conductance mechanosensitive channel/FtsZ-binding cell division protein ZapB